MQIYDTKNNELRDMTEEEKNIANNLPNPNESIDAEEALSILLQNKE